MAVSEREIQLWQETPLVESAERTVIDFVCDSLAVLWKDWPKMMKINMLEGGSSPRFSLSGECPHCGDKSVFMSITRPVTEEAQFGHRMIEAMRCQGCGEHILGIVALIPAHLPLLLAYYPVGKPNDSVDPSVPEDIGFDFAEALRCLWVRAFKAAIIMCGRALQTSCDDLGAKGASLYEQIDDLAKKGTITEPLRQWAHTVRLSRNRKAHDKGDAVPVVVSAEEREKQLESDAEAIAAFTREYFHHVYVMPEKLRAYTTPKALQGAS